MNPKNEQEVREMKKVFWALGLTVVFNLTGTAQNQKKATPSGQKSSQNVSTQAADSSDASLNSGSLSTVTNLQAELQNTLDVRNAKVGDAVLLKTTQAVKQGGQVVVPKGTSLIGRVTEVQERAKNGVPSRLGLIFDRLQGRDLSTPITASIVSIVNVHAATAVADDAGMDMSGSSSTMARTSSSGRSSSGGGLLGGVTNTVGGVTNTVGGVANSATETVGGVANTATSTLGNTTQAVGRTVNGIQISGSASGSAQSSTTLSSPNNNIRLEKGVTFNLNVQRTPGN